MEWGPVDTIILHMCTINENHMMYDSWDMKRDRQNLLLFWAIFCSFSVPKTICYTIPEIWRTTDVIIFLFWGIFCPFTLLTAQKIKILKKWKKPLGDIILHMCTKNYNQMMYSSWDIVRDGRTDRMSDGKSDI